MTNDTNTYKNYTHTTYCSKVQKRLHTTKLVKATENSVYRADIPEEQVIVHYIKGDTDV